MINRQQDEETMLGADTSSEENGIMSMSLLGGVAKPEGLPEVEDMDLQSMRGPSKLLSHGTLLIVMLFLVAAGALYAMRITPADVSGGGAVLEIEAKIEQALVKLTQPGGISENDPLNPNNLQVMFADTDEMIGLFDLKVGERQVPIDKIKKNPFLLSLKRAETDSGGSVQNAGDIREQRRLEELKRELTSMQLQTIVLGRVPVAIINGEVMQIGQTMGSFKLTAIGKTSVRLEAEGRAFRLRMSQTDATDNRRR